MASLSELAAGCNDAARLHGGAAAGTNPYFQAGATIFGCILGGVGADAQKQAMLDAANRVAAQQRGDQETALLNIAATRQQQELLAQAEAAKQNLPGWVAPVAIVGAGIALIVILSPSKKKAAS